MTKNEFERLTPGTIIRHKLLAKWTFIVHQNFGDRLVAVRSIEIRDPENWLECKAETIETDVPPISKAAHDLHEALKDNKWYQTVGRGDKEILVYTTKKKHPKPYKDFGGFPVQYRYVGKIMA